MKRDDLEKLRIPQSQRSSSGISTALIYGAVAVALIIAAWFAWPRASDAKRLVVQTKPYQADAGSPAPLHTPASPAPPPAPGDTLLSTSGYIINRERIELSPRFVGTVRWIG